MDLGIFEITGLGWVGLDWTFVSGLVTVIVVNIILSGDNAYSFAL